MKVILPLGQVGLLDKTKAVWLLLIVSLCRQQVFLLLQIHAFQLLPVFMQHRVELIFEQVFALTPGFKHLYNSLQDACLLLRLWINQNTLEAHLFVAIDLIKLKAPFHFKTMQLLKLLNTQSLKWFEILNFHDQRDIRV